MVSTLKSTFLLVGAALFITCTVAVDYSEHSVVVRMKKLDEFLNQKDSKVDAYHHIQREIERNTPKDQDFNYGESIVAMLKMLVFEERIRYVLDTVKREFNYGKYCWAVSETMIKLSNPHRKDLAAELKKVQGLSDYLLDFGSWSYLLEKSSDYDICMMAEDPEWLCFFLMLVIENSSHLKKKFTRAMMLRLNVVRNKANAIHATVLMKNPPRSEFSVRFKYNDIMFDLGLSRLGESSVQALDSQMKRISVRKATEFALGRRGEDGWNGSLNQEHAIVVAALALLEMTDGELANCIEAFALILDLDRPPFKTPVITRFYELLEQRRSASVIANSDLGNQLTKVKYLWDLRRYIVGNPLSPKYLEDMILIFRMTKRAYRDRYDTDKHAYYRGQEKMAEQDVLDNPKLYTEYDEQLIALYEVEPYDYKPGYWRGSGILPDWLDSRYTQENLKKNADKAEELLNSISTGSAHDLVRNQIRTLLRFAIQLSNIRYRRDERVESIIPSVKKIAITYIKSMKLGGDVYVKDSVIMQEWFKFTFRFSKQVAEAFKSTIKELSSFEIKNNEADIPIYVFLARTANVLKHQKRDSEASVLAKRVIEFERVVGFAVTASLPVQTQVIREMQIFYTYNGNDPLKNQTTLGQLIEHHLELITASITWDEEKPRMDRNEELTVQEMAKHKLLDAMMTAITGPNAKALLRDDLLSDVTTLESVLRGTVPVKINGGVKFFRP